MVFNTVQALSCLIPLVFLVSNTIQNTRVGKQGFRLQPLLLHPTRTK